MIERGRLKEEDPARVTEPKPTTTYTIGETEWAHRIATLEHMLSEERENVDTLRDRLAEREAEGATRRPRDATGVRRAPGAAASFDLA